MDNRFNTVAGWVLGAGIVFLGAWLVTGEMFHGGRPEVMGYPIKGVTGANSEEGASEQPIAHFLQTADAARGEGLFRKCSGCHTVNQGGAQLQGPNLYGRMGAAIASVGGYSYSEPLRGRSAETWSWENMSEWLRSPRGFAPGTKMGFGGLGEAQDRADLMVYLNAQGGNLQLPPAPAAAPAPAADPAAPAATPAENAARASDAPAEGDRAAPQPVPTQAEQQRPTGH